MKYLISLALLMGLSGCASNKEFQYPYKYIQMPIEDLGCISK